MPLGYKTGIIGHDGAAPGEVLLYERKLTGFVKAARYLVERWFWQLKDGDVKPLDPIGYFRAMSPEQNFIAIAVCSAPVLNHQAAAYSIRDSGSIVLAKSAKGRSQSPSEEYQGRCQATPSAN